MPKRKKFNAARFAMVVERHSRNFEKVQEMYQKKQIGEHDRLFTLEDVIEICFVVYKGGFFDCTLQENPKSKWSAETGARQARHYIKDAF